MAGDVKTNAFLLGEATLMLAPYSDPTPVFELKPETHSVGMVKNVNLSQEADEIELRKGIQQHLVDSKKSNVRTSLTAEVFEFSAQNLFYSLSLSQTAAPVKRGKLKTAVTGAVATIVLLSDPIPGEASTAITAASDVVMGTTILIQAPGVGNDLVLPLKVTAASTYATNELTVTVAVPAGFTFPAGSRVWVVNEIPVATTQEQDFFKVKAVGTLSNNERPVVMICPKVKIRRGFQLNFDEGNYTSMPFEFSTYFLAASEATGLLAPYTNQQIGVFIP